MTRHPLAMTSWTRASVVAVALAAGVPCPAVAAEQRRACLSGDETRQTMQSRKMVPPVRAVEAALRTVPGESVGIRLCRTEAAMIYDVVVLRRDGHLIHVLIDAGTGSLLTPRPSP